MRARAPGRPALSLPNRNVDGAAPPNRPGVPGPRRARRPKASRRPGGPRRRPRDAPDRRAARHATDGRGRALLGRPVRDDLEVAVRRPTAAPAGHERPGRRLASPATRHDRRADVAGECRSRLRRGVETTSRRLPADRVAGARWRRGRRDAGPPRRRDARGERPLAQRDPALAMPYFLDALTNAAHDVDRPAPLVQRVLTPAPRLGPAWT